MVPPLPIKYESPQEGKPLVGRVFGGELGI